LSREYVSQSERVVIKIGTNVLTERDNSISKPIMDSLVQQISSIYDGRRHFIIVSSGAIALGLRRLGIAKRPSELNLLQAAASVGQSSLMHAYEELFHKSGLETAQILLTYDDVHQRRRYLNIRNTVFTLWSYGSIPVVNENDTVAFEEIRFGDNDLLAAHLSIMIEADLLLILTDIDGVYDKNPKQNHEARVLKTIPQITQTVLHSAKGKGSLFSSGGMESKLYAARTATKGGVGVIIANGKSVDLKKLLSGEEIGS
jgi:glutamate 5-kinase